MLETCISLMSFHCSVSFEFQIPAYSFTLERKASYCIRVKHFIINYLDLIFQWIRNMLGCSVWLWSWKDVKTWGSPLTSGYIVNVLFWTYHFVYETKQNSELNSVLDRELKFSHLSLPFFNAKYLNNDRKSVLCNIRVVQFCNLYTE